MQQFLHSLQQFANRNVNHPNLLSANGSDFYTTDVDAGFTLMVAYHKELYKTIFADMHLSQIRDRSSNERLFLS